MTPETRTATLKALKKVASVYGVMLQREHDIIFSDLSFDTEKVKKLSGVVDDIVYYYAQEKRVPDQLAFRYDGGNLVILFKEAHRMVILHHDANEVDRITSAAAAFFRDYLTGEAIKTFSGTAKLEPSRNRGVIEPTAPIMPAESAPS